MVATAHSPLVASLLRAERGCFRTMMMRDTLSGGTAENRRGIQSDPRRGHLPSILSPSLSLCARVSLSGAIQVKQAKKQEKTCEREVSALIADLLVVRRAFDCLVLGIHVQIALQLQKQSREGRR